ncbi:hypothetical protein ABPG74_009276 [Tetrahymena malaccensis]
MKFKISTLYLIQTFAIVAISASPGNPVQCLQPSNPCDDTNCGPLPPGAACQWTDYSQNNSTATNSTSANNSTSSNSTNPACIISDCSCYNSNLSGLTDLFCKSCGQQSNQFANLAGTSCVSSSETCGSNRTPNTWTDADCALCNPQTPFASSDKSSCVANSQQNNCNATSGLTDAICASCGQQNVNNSTNSTNSSSNNSTNSTQLLFANYNGTACVASSASCGSNRAPNTWNDADCALCNPQTPFASSDKSSCVANSQQNNCNATSGLTDAICASCSQQNNSTNANNNSTNPNNNNSTNPNNNNSTNSTQLLFANYNGTACVASSASCGSNRAPKTWNDADCALCNPQTPFASSDKSSCVANSQQNNCNATSGLTDAICASCGQQNVNNSTNSTNSSSNNSTNSTQLLFANYNGTACVASSASCGSSRAPNTWNDADCAICNPQTPFASSDKSSCVANSQQNNCNATSGLTDAICASCSQQNNSTNANNNSTNPNNNNSTNPNNNNSTNSTQLLFANYNGTACVASSASCGSSRAPNTWNDADCALCNPQTPFASSDKSSCVANSQQNNCNATSGLTDAICASCSQQNNSTNVQNNSTNPNNNNSTNPNNNNSTNSTQVLFANYNGTACVASSASCGSSRAPNTWTDADCALCNPLTPVASSDKSQCIASHTNNGNSTGSGNSTNSNNNNSTSMNLNIYANLNGTACVASSATCGSNRAPNSWTDSDCALCNPLTPFASTGGASCVGVSNNNCTSTSGLTDSICYACAQQINNTNSTDNSTNANNGNYTNNANNTNNTSSNLNIFANANGTACVASNATCGSNRKINTWTDGDCLLCSPDRPLASSGGEYCFSFSPSNCTATLNLTDSICFECAQLNNQNATQYNNTNNNQNNTNSNQNNTNDNSNNTNSNSTIPNYNNSTNSTNSNSTSSQNITIVNNRVYANILGNSCVASSATCGIKRAPNTWSDSDCALCSPYTPFASLDGSKCVSSRSINCQVSFNLTDFICAACAIQYNDNKFWANNDGSSCVPTQATCGSARSIKWTNLDCSLCNTQTPVASADGLYCIPSSFGSLLAFTFSLMVICAFYY